MAAHSFSLPDTCRDMIIQLGPESTYNVSQFLREYRSNVVMKWDDRLVEQLDTKYHVDASNPRYRHIYNGLDTIASRLRYFLSREDPVFKHAKLRKTGSIASNTKVGIPGIPHESDYMLVLPDSLDGTSSEHISHNLSSELGDSDFDCKLYQNGSNVSNTKDKLQDGIDKLLQKQQLEQQQQTENKTTLSKNDSVLNQLNDEEMGIDTIKRLDEKNRRKNEAQAECEVGLSVDNLANQNGTDNKEMDKNAIKILAKIEQINERNDCVSSKLANDRLISNGTDEKGIDKQDIRRRDEEKKRMKTQDDCVSQHKIDKQIRHNRNNHKRIDKETLRMFCGGILA